MLKRISSWLLQFSKGWVTLTALVIFLLFIILVLPGQSSQDLAVRGAAASPDLSFFYTADELHRMAEAYGAEGRETFIRTRFSFDLVWPTVYTFFLVTSISWLSKRAFDPVSPWQQANIIPLLGALFDLFENIGTSLVMFYYPHLLPVIPGLAGFFTLIKWTLVGGSFLLLVACAVSAAWQRYNSRRLT